MSTPYNPYVVYTHILDYIEYRGLTTGEEDIPQDASKIAAMLTQSGYHAFFARPVEQEELYFTTVILLVMPNSKYIQHGSDFSNLIKPTTFGKRQQGSKEYINEIVIVLPNNVIDKKNLVTAIDAARKANEEIEYIIHPYKLFSVKIPDVVCIPRHRIMSQSEVTAYLLQGRNTHRNLQLITASDPPVAWLGAKPGQLIEIERPSENACVATTVRLVVKD